MAGSNSVSFLTPQDAVQQQISMQEAQRQQDLADALRQRSLTPIQVQSGSSSWTQGLAQLAQAVAANHLNRAAKAATYSGTINAANASARALGAPGDVYDTSQNPYSTSEHGRNLIQRLGDFVSGGPPVNRQMPPAPAGQGGLPNASATPPMAAPMPPAVAAQSGIMPTPNNAPVNQGAGPTPTVGQPAPSQTGDASSPASASSGNSQPVNPLALTGDWQSNYMLANRDPGEYNKALVAKAAPNALENTIAHAQAAFARGDINTGVALMQSVQKQNYMEPTNVREGGMVLDPITHQPIFQSGKSTPGTVINYADGKPASMSVIAGAPDALKATTGAEAQGRAQGELVEVTDGAGNRFQVPKAGLLHGGGNAQQGGPGALDARFGGGGGSGTPGNMSAIGPGAAAANTTYGKASGEAFASIQNSARDAPQRINALREIGHLSATGTATGPAAAKLQELGEATGLNFLVDPNGQVIAKDMARYGAQMASEVGLNGSDARLGAVMHASPNMKMTPQALNTVLPTFIGLEMAKGARGQAGAAWAASHGAQDNANFETAWRQNYDPRMFTQMAKGPQAFASNVSHLDAPTRNMYLQKYRALKSMGVDFAGLTQ